jgi:hypothetical protein
MKIKSLFCVLLLSVALISCGGSKGSELKYAIEGQTENGFEDGVYCADVTYFNPNTGTKSDYVLKVDVAGNKVVKINFGNGGWLDSDHITPKLLDDNGKCTLTTDRNYEYSVKITGRNCNVSTSFNPETDEEIPVYSFEQCADKYNLSESEKRECLEKGLYKRDEKLSEKQCALLGKYINEIREIDLRSQENINKINAETQEKQNEIKGKQSNLQNEINNGYILNIERRSAYGVSSQIITIKKRGVNYLLEVRGSAECSMGTARFDENASGWQMVYIKQYPDVDKWSGHSMRIIDSGF